MSYRVTFLDTAKLDMDDIEEYLSQFYPSTASNFFTMLKDKVLNLEDFLFMYPEYEYDPYFRKMIIDDYLLFYCVDESRYLVVIHRMFHSKRDVSQQLLEHRTP